MPATQPSLVQPPLSIAQQIDDGREYRDNNTMADSTVDVVDPRLRSSTPGGTSLTFRNVEEPDPGDGSSDEGEKEGDDGSAGPGTKRRKLNLWKCKQCREARKKVRIIMALRSSGGNAGNVKQG